MYEVIGLRLMCKVHVEVRSTLQEKSQACVGATVRVRVYVRSTQYAAEKKNKLVLGLGRE